MAEEETVEPVGPAPEDQPAAQGEAAPAAVPAATEEATAVPAEETALPGESAAEVPVLEPVAVEEPPAEDLNAKVLAASRRHTRRSFAMAAVAAAAAYAFYQWIDRSSAEQMQPWPLRRALLANADLSRAIFGERALAPTYPPARAENLRVNGVYGLKQALQPESWRLQVVGVRRAAEHPRFAKDVTAWQYRYSGPDQDDQGHDTKVAPSADTAEKMAPAPMLDQERLRQSRALRMPRGQEEAGESRSTLQPGTPGLLLTLADLAMLPREELVTHFKCIEGWSQIVQCAGVRMADFLEAYPPEQVNGRMPPYVYMETPNGDYYTGYHLGDCRHPQTLLVTEMMGQPLTQAHGAPLRLYMQIKYGYK
ncbi:MAG TPA: molybdopterin-dependent oxidoreductase, partial [Acidobacteriaceae bacterium]